MSKKTLLDAAQALAKVLPRSGDGLTAYHAREPLLELRQAIADEIAARDRPNALDEALEILALVLPGPRPWTTENVEAKLRVYRNMALDQRREVEPGKLEVGLSANEMEVLVNHPEMLTAPGMKGGYIVFSPKQAVDFGTLMIRKAGECKRRAK